MTMNRTRRRRCHPSDECAASACRLHGVGRRSRWAFQHQSADSGVRGTSDSRSEKTGERNAARPTRAHKSIALHRGFRICKNSGGGAKSECDVGAVADSSISRNPNCVEQSAVSRGESMSSAPTGATGPPAMATLVAFVTSNRIRLTLGSDDC